eukprot:CAMPEP_0168587928 /NCGR_PEP_ID=MMETSP0420-20121227/5154_1 /TAXON_ID=498008 /ORGANISM="Pessonella sp." /LENGTH=434 /DNA_ID=CAMNT_0008623269 /DNA_START=389 /DNA_END=1693 /DNA_ORIENTATION=-
MITFYSIPRELFEEFSVSMFRTLSTEDGFDKNCEFFETFIGFRLQNVNYDKRLALIHSLKSDLPRLSPVWRERVNEFVRGETDPMFLDYVDLMESVPTKCGIQKLASEQKLVLPLMNKFSTNAEFAHAIIRSQYESATKRVSLQEHIDEFADLLKLILDRLATAKQFLDERGSGNIAYLARKLDKYIDIVDQKEYEKEFKLALSEADSKWAEDELRCLVREDGQQYEFTGDYVFCNVYEQMAQDTTPLAPHLKAKKWHATWHRSLAQKRQEAKARQDTINRHLNRLGIASVQLEDSREFHQEGNGVRLCWKELTRSIEGYVCGWRRLSDIDRLPYVRAAALLTALTQAGHAIDYDNPPKFYNLAFFLKEPRILPSDNDPFARIGLLPTLKIVELLHTNDTYWFMRLGRWYQGTQASYFLALVSAMYVMGMRSSD